MLLCVAQYAVAFGDKEANMAVCDRLCRAAHEKGAELIVFPELSLTGFSLDETLAESSDGASAAYFRELAVRYGLCCVFGYAQRRGRQIFNVLAAVDRDGGLLAEYAKIHPFSFGGEDKVFSAGDRLSVFSCCGIDIGLTICYDLRFPELYRELSKSCQCIIVSANWGAARASHWSTLLRARAIEDQCYIVGCNCICGTGMTCAGGSEVISPDGKPLQTADEKEALLFAEITAENVNNIRSAFPLANDRRNEIYRNFYE